MMNRNGTTYILLYAFALAVVAALVLSLASFPLQPRTGVSVPAVMLAVTLAWAFSSLALSAMDRIVPPVIRTLVQVVVVAFFMSLAYLLTKAFAYESSCRLSVIMSFIAASAAILFRIEKYTSGYKPVRALTDGLFNGLACSLAMLAFSSAVAAYRSATGLSEVNALTDLLPVAFIITGCAFWLKRCLVKGGNDHINTWKGLPASFAAITLVSLPVSWLLIRYFLQPGALIWLGASFAGVDLSFLEPAAYLSVTVSVALTLRAALQRYSGRSIAADSKILPVAALGCALAGSPILDPDCQFADVAGVLDYAIRCGLIMAGSAAVVSAISRKMRYSDVPSPLRGPGISLISIGLMGLALRILMELTV